MLTPSSTPRSLPHPSSVLPISIGRGFPLDLQRRGLQVTGIFNGQKRTSEAGQPGAAPQFNSILRWRLDKETYLAVQHEGTSLSSYLVSSPLF
jgi:hypothetical protein